MGQVAGPPPSPSITSRELAPYTVGLAGMGPAGSGSHAEGESIDLRSIVRQAQRSAILISRLAREPSPQ